MVIPAPRRNDVNADCLLLVSLLDYFRDHINVRSNNLSILTVLVLVGRSPSGHVGDKITTQICLRLE